MARAASRPLSQALDLLRHQSVQRDDLGERGADGQLAGFATALRMAAQSLHRSQSVLGDWFRRLKAKLGTKAATTAAAHKLARILYAMVKHRRPYDPDRLGNPELRRARKERFLRRQAQQLGFTLTPLGGEVS